MLLFSTILDVQDFVTEDDFLKLVLEWNQGSRRPENIVPGIDWHGEKTAKYGDSNLSLEFADYPEQKILAVRHEKVANDSVVWDSDFIMNFREKRLAIRLDRTFSEEALVMDAAFSTPHILTFLIEHGYLKDDADLPVLRTPIAVSDQNITMLSKVFAEEKAYELPIVYVSKTASGADPLDTDRLASRLKGAAHVLTEAGLDQCAQIRELCGGTRGSYGAVRIFYPAQSVSMKKSFFGAIRATKQSAWRK